MNRFLILAAAGLVTLGPLAAISAPAAAQERQVFPRQEWPGRTNRQPPQPIAPPPVVPDPVVTRLQERVDDLEAALRDTTRNQEQMQQTISAQRSQIDLLQRSLDDLASKVRAVEARQDSEPLMIPQAPAADAALAPTLEPTPAATAPAAPPNTAFKAAKDMLIRGDFSAAEAAFRGFIQAFPNDPQATEARYWLGESLYVQASYSDAASAYLDLLRTAPQAPQAADALVKLAASLRQAGQPSDACSVLRDFNRTYPNASAATRERAQAEARAAACRV